MQFEDFDREVAAFQSRLRDLRAARRVTAEGDDENEALFLELETAAEELRVAHEELWVSDAEQADQAATEDQDRYVLRAAFRDLPLPVMLLYRDGRIRRVNQRCLNLLELSADYLSGRPLPALVELPQRSALRSQIAAVTRRRGTRTVTLTFVVRGRVRSVRALLGALHVPNDPKPVIAAVLIPTDDALADDPAGPSGEDAAAVLARTTAGLPALVRRLDLVTSVAQLLTSSHGDPDAAIARALGDLLCVEFADWIIVDLMRADGLVRAAVCGPEGATDREVLAAIQEAEPYEAALPAVVAQEGQSQLLIHLDDYSVLGEDRDGVPLAGRMRARSLLCLPIGGEAVLGTITAARTAGSSYFALADLAALEDVGGLLGGALRAERRFVRQHRSHLTLRDLLIPTSVTLEQLDVAWLYRPATSEEDPGSVVFDLYPSNSGGNILLAETATAGGHAATELVALRQSARTLGLAQADPVGLLEDVTARLSALGGLRTPVLTSAAHVSSTATGAAVRLVSAGHHLSLHRRLDGRVQAVDGGGRALEGGAEAVLHFRDLDLVPGEALVMFTTSLYDVRARTGDTFGRSGALAQAVARAGSGSAQSIVDQIGAALATFDIDDGLPLDVLALCLRVPRDG
ncbi:MAG: SpoIIE family protein phosphatase [Actinomycetota bacterium]|nr:SpoIIE family protein phosphatase [Actinomycetota bacterium]